MGESTQFDTGFPDPASRGAPSHIHPMVGGGAWQGTKAPAGHGSPACLGLQGRGPDGKPPLGITRWWEVMLRGGEGSDPHREATIGTASALRPPGGFPTTRNQTRLAGRGSLPSWTPASPGPGSDGAPPHIHPIVGGGVWQGTKASARPGSPARLGLQDRGFNGQPPLGR